MREGHFWGRVRLWGVRRWREKDKEREREVIDDLCQGQISFSREYVGRKRTDIKVNGR